MSLTTENRWILGSAVGSLLGAQTGVSVAEQNLQLEAVDPGTAQEQRTGTHQTVTRATGVTTQIALGIEAPIANGTYSGITDLRGYAVHPNGIRKVDLYIDGRYKSQVPYGGSRSDVGNAYPSYMNSSKSGFSMARNYSLLSPGLHSFTIRVTANDNSTTEGTINVYTDRFGSNVYIPSTNDISLDTAQVSASGSQITISGVRVGSGYYTATLKWDVGAQGMRFQSIGTSSAFARNGGESLDNLESTFGQSDAENCVTVPLINDGTALEWVVTSTQEGSSSSESVNALYERISATGAVTLTTTTPLSGDGPTRTVRESESYRISNNTRYISRVESGYNNATDSTVTYTPELASGPVGRHCVGDSWVTEPVDSTLSTMGTIITDSTPFTTGSVEAIDEWVTVPAGQFNTVKVTTQDTHGTTTSWTDVVTGALVRQTFQAADGAEKRTELTSLN